MSSIKTGVLHVGTTGGTFNISTTTTPAMGTGGYVVITGSDDSGNEKKLVITRY